MRKGFTIIELLVGMGIMSILIVTFVTFFSRTLDTTKSFDIQNELLAEGQIASQLASSRLQEAWHVWGSGSAFTINGTWKFQNPNTGANSWTIGTDPMAAVTLPPTNLSVLCATGTPAGCYRFYAVYGIKRSVYVTNTATSLSNRLLADSANPNAWVMMQMECTLDASNVTPGSTTQLAPTTTITTSNCKSDLLADYLTPVVSNSYKPFERTSVNQVTLDLRFSRIARGRTFSVGGSSSPLKSVILMRNQGILPPQQGAQ